MADVETDEDTKDSKSYNCILGYTIVVVVMSAFASILLFYYSNRLYEEDPPKIIINVRGRRVLYNAYDLQELRILWVRIIAVLYGVICILAACSLFTLPSNKKSDTSISLWLILHAIIDILAIVAIFLSHARNFENIWKFLPIPILAVGMFIWIFNEGNLRKKKNV